MKILLTNATCIQDIYGGVPRAIDEIASFFSEQGHEVFVFVPDRKSKGTNVQVINSNYKIIRYSYFKNIFKPLNVFSTLFFYFKYLKNIKFDIIWGHSPEPWLFMPKKAKKIIYSVHGPWILESKLDGTLSYIKKLLIKLFYKLLINKKTIVHFDSNYVLEQCFKETAAFNNSQTIISPALINEKLLNEPSYSILANNIDISKLNILVSRRLVNRTGVIEFLQNCISFPEEIKKQLNIIIVGSGYLENKIKIISEKFSFITFLGSVKQVDLDYLYKTSDICCMPSKNAEGFGVSILEALFRGTPVVYTRGGGMGDFLDSFTYNFGYQFDNKNELYKIIQMCLILKKEDKLNFEPTKIPYNFKKNIDRIINV